MPCRTPSPSQAQGAALNAVSCPDCHSILTPSERADHWKLCKEPSPDVLNHRVRSGLVPLALPVSPSSLGQYKLCPARYKFSYVDRLPRTSGAPADMGKRAHAYIASRIAGEIQRERPIEFADELDWQRLQRHLDTIAFDTEHLIGLEETLRFKWAEGDWTVYGEGRLDALRIDDNGIADVDDWKTGYKVKNDISDDPDMLFYALAVVNNYSQVVGVRAHQIQLARGAIRHAFYSIEKIDRFNAFLKRRAKQIINDQVYKPKPGDQCRICDYVEHCTVGQDYLGTALVPANHALVSTENALEYAGALTQLSNLVDRAKGPLEVYTEWNGPVYLDDERDQAWGHWPKAIRTVPDLQAFVDACIANHVDPLSVLKVDVDELKKRKLYRLLDLLTTSVHTYFGFRKNLNSPRGRRPKELPAND